MNASKTITIGVLGAAGRMGRMLIQACHADAGLRVGAAVEVAGHELVGTDAGHLAGIGGLDVPITDDLGACIDGVDVIVDFTRPEPTLNALKLCHQARKRAVVGTTGIAPTDREHIATLGEDIAIVLAPNMSVGVNLAFSLIGAAAKVLGDSVDVEVIEAHHRHKVDAPSGTAVRMGEILAESLGRDLAKCAVYGREGHTGERDPKTIGFETIRAGDIVGEHTVLFADTGERLEITHKASSRMNFARGAMRAVHWVMDRPVGLYDMQDVLGLR